MSKEVMKKTGKHSFFRTVKTASNKYNWQTLEIPEFYRELAERVL